GRERHRRARPRRIGSARAAAGGGGAAVSLPVGAAEPRGALETAAALRSGELDVLEHTEAALRSARTIGAAVGAYAHLLEDLSREQARAAAERIEDARRSGGTEQLAAALPLLG